MPTYPYQFRRDTLANWKSANPVLREGEMGLELPGVVGDDGVRMFKFKIGDGVTAWNALPYASGPAGPSPEYQWNGTSLRFMNPDGTWGSYVNLRGPQGAKGEQGDPGPAGTATPATTTEIGGVIIGDNINVTAEGCASVNDGSTSQKGVVQLTNATNSKTGKLAASDTALANTYAEATKAASTSAAGRVQLSDAVNSADSTTAATSKAVKAAYDKAVSAANAAAGKVTLKGTRTTTGTWTLTGLTVGKPLFVLGSAPADNRGSSYCYLNVISGTNDGLFGTASYRFLLGAGNTQSTNPLIVVPTQTSVSFDITSFVGNFTVRAYQ